MNIDGFDEKIMYLLKSDGRIRLNKLADIIGLSAPACHSRILKLESFGFIKGYYALLDHKKVGYDVVCLVFVNFEDHTIQKRKIALSTLMELDEVIEVLHITGIHDLQLRVMVKDSSALNELINTKISTIAGISKIQTSMVLDVCKPMNKCQTKSNILAML